MVSASVLCAVCFLMESDVMAADAHRESERAVVPMESGAHVLVLSRIRHYLNSLHQFTARFSQFTEDGGFARGRISVWRPGRMRVDYDPPVSLEIIADGRHVFFHDRARDTVNSTSLGNFPAGFLLERYIDFGGRFDVTAVEVSQNDILVNVLDKDHRDIGDIELLFHDRPLRLAQWVIRDMRGASTQVRLSDIRKVNSFDRDTFQFRRPAQSPFSPSRSRR